MDGILQYGLEQRKYIEKKSEEKRESLEEKKGNMNENPQR